jgi:hypothetical protein
MSGGFLRNPHSAAGLAAIRHGTQSLYRHASFITAGMSIACLAWCFFVDLEIGPIEACRVFAGLACLWLPVGSLVYLLLSNRCSDTLTRATLSAVASYGLTTPAYALFGACGLAVPGFQWMFYAAQSLILLGVLAYVLKNKLTWRVAEVLRGWQKLDWTLILLIALSILVTKSYKATFTLEPDQTSRRLVMHGDATYLSSLAYELGRQTPAQQQSVRSGIKERAYHMYPHLTAMLVARYTGQPDILQSLMHYQFTVVEVLLCLTLFCTVRGVTGSRAAGYIAVALIYVLAIPLPPVGPNAAGYWYFTWFPHATSSLEPSVLNSPQTYCALPVVLGTLLFVTQFSIEVSQRRAAGTLAVLMGLLAAALLRFRVQSFLILFPGLMVLFLIAAWRLRQWRFLAAGCLAALAVGVQLLEMKMPVYYPASASILIHNNHLGRDCILFNSWPGADLTRVALDYCLYPKVYDWAWQIVCLALFAVFNMAGLPGAMAGVFHWFKRSTWQAPTWAYSGMLAWLTVGTIAGSTCLSTPYDYWSVGGQSLFMIGWYLLPLLAIGLWQAGPLLPPRLLACKPYAPVAAALLLVAACTWQRVREMTPVQAMYHTGPVISGDEWAAMMFMRSHLPDDAVLLTKASHHPTAACMLSGIAGRASFLEYFCMGGPLGGGAYDQWHARLARIDRVWDADDSAAFAAAVLDTGATHLVEYAENPLRLHPGDCLEEVFGSPNGGVKIWKFQASESARNAARIARMATDPTGAPYRSF